MNNIMYRNFLITILFSVSVSLSAHPHIFANSGIKVVFNDNGIEGFFVTLEFDKIFSQDLKENFDTNKDGLFSKKEIENIKNNAFENLKNFNYFTHLIYGGKKITFSTYSGFKALVKEQKVQYVFFLPFSIEASSVNEKFKITNYDHSYYIDVTLMKSMIEFEKSDNYEITMKYFDDQSQLYYMEQIPPSTALISFKKKN